MCVFNKLANNKWGFQYSHIPCCITLSANLPKKSSSLILNLYSNLKLPGKGNIGFNTNHRMVISHLSTSLVSASSWATLSKLSSACAVMACRHAHLSCLTLSAFRTWHPSCEIFCPSAYSVAGTVLGVRNGAENKWPSWGLDCST